MKICPTCSAHYTDDANFCPMDATRLLPEPAPPPPAQAPVQAPTLRDGERLIGDRFLLTSSTPLAVTKTGKEYDAVDGQDGQPVCLKIIDSKVLPTAMSTDRAVREFKQLAKITSNRIAHIIDQGKTDTGEVFVVTEALRSITLEELIMRDGALSCERAKAIAIAVGEALSEAQKVGVVHRDVAPQNVLLVGERIILTGFGVAPPVTDRVFGTPAFVSPEQAEGKPVDQRSNIYSLGALFYFALTASTPFENGEISLDADSMLRQHLHSQPVPPSQRRAGLTPEFDKVLLKTLEKSGGRRHLTLRQLISELDALVPPASLADVPPPSQRAAAATPTPQKPIPDTLPSMETVQPQESVENPAPKPQERPVEKSGKTAKSGKKAPSPAAAEPATTPAVAAANKESPKEAAPSPTSTGEPDANIHVLPTAKLAAPAPKPAPAEALPAPAKGAATTPGKPKKKGFRETAWFKKGEIEEQLAQKAAQANSEDPLAGPATTEAVVDDATLTEEDRVRLSLRSSGTEAMSVIRKQSILGERMSEAEMLAEVDSSKKWIIVFMIVIGAIAMAVLLFFLLRSPTHKAVAAPTNPPSAAQPQ